jgi:pimeloyl-ACP methyl ester carboxylesterase
MAGYREDHYEINGIDTAVFTAGDGEPLVYIHGGGTATGFDALLPLADTFRLIVPHHPGFGASADDPRIDGAQDYVLHYLDLFDALGLDEITLVGHSLGGLIGSGLATAQPHRVRRLVLVAPYGLDVPAHPTVNFFDIPEQEVMAYLSADMSVFADLMPPTPEFLAERAREAVSLERVIGRRSYDPTLAKWLHRLTMPTLLLWGDADRVIPAEQAPVWAAHLPRAETRILPGIGHLVFDETRDAAVAVADFASS